MRIVPALLITLLVVTAGCSSLSGTEGDAATVAPGLDTTSTTTGTPAGEWATTGYLPGVSPMLTTR